MCDVNWDMLQLLGEGYGEAVAETRKARAIDRLLARYGGDRQYEYLAYWHGCYDDPQDYNYESGSRWCRITLRQVLATLYDHALRYGAVDGFMNESLSDQLSIWRECGASDCGGVGPLLTPDEANRGRQEKRRLELEDAAASFAAECGHKVGTPEYVRAARRAIADCRYERQRWNDCETRMEQWAACRYAGVGAAVYCDDLNFENGRFDSSLDRLGDVLRWLEDNCPLLMRQCEQDCDTQ